MGKRDSKKAPKTAAKDDNTVAAEPFVVIASLGLIGTTLLLTSSQMCYSQTEGRTHFVFRFVAFVVLEMTLGTLLTIPMIALARNLQPTTPQPSSLFMGEDENTSNEEGIQWPCSTALSTLPPDWHLAAANLVRNDPKCKRPYFLNHTRGALRCKQAAARTAAALGTLINLVVTTSLLEGRGLASVGLTLDGPFAVDVVTGCVVGFGLVACMSIAELALGWTRKTAFFELFDIREKFWHNIGYDMWFHAAVAVNEESPLRGWMLLNSAEALALHFGYSGSSALLASAAMQAAVFSALHLASPGASRLGLANLTLGGIAGATNVLLTGSLGFALGWHWAWNVTMGNVFGRSTSGIPISATVIAVVPHPAKADMHGGTFGPEGGVLAPVVYVAGMIAVYSIYGLDRWGHIAEGMPVLAGAIGTS